MLRVGKELLLGEEDGYLEVLATKTSNITSAHEFTEGLSIYDMIAIDGSRYLLAAYKGIMKTTKDQLIKHYYRGRRIISMCHVTYSIYLLGF